MHTSLSKQLMTANVRPSCPLTPLGHSQVKPPSRRGHICLSASSVSNANQSVVITGASTGIGRDTALHLAHKGWTVFAGVRSKSAQDDLGALHPNIRPLVLDVKEQDSIQQAARQVEEQVGSIRGLVNNAGKGAMCPAEFFPLDTFKDVFEVNVFGVLACSQAFLPLLRKSGDGRIINMSSVAGNLALPMFGAYTSSKHALEGLSDCMRYELQPHGVKVILIKPGPVRTPIWSKSRDASRKAMDTLSAEAQVMYDDQIKLMDRMSKQSEENGIEAEEVSELVYTALAEPQPRSRYIVGRGAPLTMLMKRLLPDRLWDPILQSSLRQG